MLAILAALLAGCTLGGTGPVSGNASCSFGGLSLVTVICIRSEPGLHPDGTWTYPASNPVAATLHPGSIVVVAGKSVRRIESVTRIGSQLSLTTASVPLTEVIKDGKIPLAGSVTPGTVTKTVDQPPPPPPPESPPATPSPSPSPSLSLSLPPSPTSSPPPPVTPKISASIRAVRSEYKGSCSAPTAGDEPEFDGTITVSAGPVVVAYHWTLTDPKGTATPITGTMSFPGTGPQTQTVSFSVPVNTYAPDTVNDGEISFQVDRPGTAIAPEHPRYVVACAALPASPTDAGSSGPRVSAVPGGRLAGRPSAHLLAHADRAGSGYQVVPVLTLSKDSFLVDVTASHQIGPAQLTWKVHGELDDFFSGGVINIVNHRLQNSGLDATRLRGQLRFDWSLSAAVPGAALGQLGLDLPIRLFVLPLPVGDFPVFLTVEVHLHVAPEFTPGQALHGYASVSFSGGQGLSIHLDTIEHPTGPSVGGLRLDPGIRNVLTLPTLQAGVDFPYLSLGDDFYSSGAWLWTSPDVAISIVPGHNPVLCARAEADASASVGTEFELFGLREPLSVKVYDRPLPSPVSFPRSPECVTS